MASTKVSSRLSWNQKNINTAIGIGEHITEDDGYSIKEVAKDWRKSVSDIRQYVRLLHDVARALDGKKNLTKKEQQIVLLSNKVSKTLDEVAKRNHQAACIKRFGSN